MCLVARCAREETVESGGDGIGPRTKQIQQTQGFVAAEELDFIFTQTTSSFLVLLVLLSSFLVLLSTDHFSHMWLCSHLSRSELI